MLFTVLDSSGVSKPSNRYQAHVHTVMLGRGKPKMTQAYDFMYHTAMGKNLRFPK